MWKKQTQTSLLNVAMLSGMSNFAGLFCIQSIITENGDKKILSWTMKLPWSNSGVFSFRRPK